MKSDIPKLAGQVSLLLSYVRGAIDVDETSKQSIVLIKIQSELLDMARTIIPDYEERDAT